MKFSNIGEKPFLNGDFTIPVAQSNEFGEKDWKGMTKEQLLELLSAMRRLDFPQTIASEQIIDDNSGNPILDPAFLQYDESGSPLIDVDQRYYSRYGSDSYDYYLPIDPDNPVFLMHDVIYYDFYELCKLEISGVVVIDNLSDRYRSIPGFGIKTPSFASVVYFPEINGNTAITTVFITGGDNKIYCLSYYHLNEEYGGWETPSYTQVQADWNATSGSAFIQNKPALKTPGNKVALGLNAGSTNNGGSTVAIGESALRLANGISSGEGNTSIGGLSCNHMTSGIRNVAVGLGALYSATTAMSNTIIGHSSMFHNLSGSNNSGLGSDVFANIISGDNNVAIGTNAGASVSSNAVSDNSIFIGYNAKAQSSGQTNQIVIGYNATGAGSNTVTLGNSSIATSILQGDVRPSTDNAKTLGTTSNRWSTIYAGTGTINTSDARKKTLVEALTVDELNAAKQLSREIGTFKFLDAVAEKGDAARHHVGMTVQRAIEIMQDNNLNPFAYGFICYDSWVDEIIDYPAVDAQEAIVDEESGVVLRPATEAVEAHSVTIRTAGDIYSFRTDELLLFIAKGIDQRLTALEER